MQRRDWIGVLAMVFVNGCAPAGGRGAEQGDLGDGGSETEDSGSELREVVIPMRPKDTGALYAGLAMLDPQAQALHLAGTVTLAQGDAYPDSYRVTMPRRWWALCGSAEGTVRLNSMAPSDTGVVTAQLSGDDSIALTQFTPGVEVIEAEGEVELDEPGCGMPAGTVMSFQVTLTIDVREAAGGLIGSPCESPILMAPSTREDAQGYGSWIYGALVDSSGEVFNADNAEPDAQLTVRLRGALDPVQAELQALSQWTTPSQPGLVEVEADGGEVVVVDVVDASRVTNVALEYQLAGAGGGPQTIAPDEHHGEKGWARTANRLAPMVQSIAIGDRMLCSPPAAEWFQLASTTPETCRVLDLPDDDGYELYGSGVGSAARLAADGLCALILDAPGVPAVADFPRSFAATFANVDGLHE